MIRAKAKEVILITFGAKLRALRKSQRMTQEGLAAKAGCDVSYVGQIERGKRSPTLLVLYSLAEALEIRPSEIVSLCSSNDVPNFLRERFSVILEKHDEATLRVLAKIMEALAQ